MDPYVVEEILNQPDNQHCLVQPCLGLNAHPRQPGDFRLEGFDLSLSDMRDIGINVVDLAGAIGLAFALLHYGCELSGHSVQFAFGTSPTEKLCLGSSYTVQLHLFNFGFCERVTSRTGSDAPALVFANAMFEPCLQKFIPSPLKNPALYKVFKDAYIENAKKGLNGKCILIPHNAMKHDGRHAARQFL